MLSNVDVSQSLVNKKISTNEHENCFKSNRKKFLIISITFLSFLILSFCSLLIHQLYISNEIHKKELTKKILIIATGGTITSTKKNGYLTPTIDIQTLLKKVPELQNLCQIEGLQIMSKDSTNMNYNDWSLTANKIFEYYEKYDGFIVLHGTDTMAYGAAIMSYFIQNSKKPIIFTGAQKSIDEKKNDAKQNLYDAFKVSLSDKVHGVKIVFNGKIIEGVRAKKVKSKSYDAFVSIDIEPDIIKNNKVIIKNHLNVSYENEDKDNVKFSIKYDKRVFLIKLTPGIDYNFLKYLEDDYKVIILESFGMGGIPNYNIDEDEDTMNYYNYDNCTDEEENKFLEEIRRLKEEKGIEFIVGTQIVNEGTHMGVYAVGKNDLNLLETQSMTTEAVKAKSVWALAESEGNMEIFRELFLTNVGNDRINMYN